MDSNATLLEKSLSNHSNQTIPLYLSYLKLFGLTLGVPLVKISAMIMIAIMVTSRKQRNANNRNNIFFANLLIADIGFAVIQWSISGTTIVLYLLDVPNLNCTISHMLIRISVLDNRLMFLPITVNRLLNVAFPFSYKRIMSIKVVITIISCLWMLVILLSYASKVDHFEPYLPLGECQPKQASRLTPLVTAGSLIISYATITTTSLYLRYKIIKSIRFFHRVKGSAAEEKKSIKAGRLVEALQEQLKPTLSLFLAGGIDGAFSLLAAIIIVTAIIFQPFPFLYIRQFALIPLQYCQSMSHALVYGFCDKKIHEKLLNLFGFNQKHSKVIALNRK